MQRGVGLNLLLRNSGNRLAAELRGRRLEIAEAEMRQRVRRRERHRPGVAGERQLDALASRASGVAVEHPRVRRRRRERNQLVTNL